MAGMRHFFVMLHCYHGMIHLHRIGVAHIHAVHAGLVKVTGRDH